MVRETPTSPPAGIFTFLGGLLLLAVFAFGVLYWVRATPATDDVTKRRNALRKETRLKLDEQYQTQLTTDGWIDKKKGLAHVPIEEAMELVIAERKGGKVSASTVKLDAPLPPIVIDPKSSEPPPVALPSAPQGAVNIRFDTPEATGQPAASPAAVAAPASAAPAGVTPTRPLEPPPEPRPATTPPPPAPALPPSVQAPPFTLPPRAPTSAPQAPAPAPQPPAPAPEAAPAPVPPPAPAAAPTPAPAPEASPAPAAVPSAPAAPPAPAPAPEAPATPANPN